MKKALLILLAFFTITSCTNKKEIPEEKIDIYEEIDKKFDESGVSYTRKVELNAANYYAKEGWQYAIDEGSCIVDVYYFGEESNMYKDALDKGAIRAKEYDNQYFLATVNKGMAAIIWDGCNNSEIIKNILMNL